MLDLWNPNYKNEGVNSFHLVPGENNDYDCVLYDKYMPLKYTLGEYKIEELINNNFPYHNKKIQDNILAVDMIFQINDIHSFVFRIFGNGGRKYILWYKNKTLKLYIKNEDQFLYIIRQLKTYKKGAHNVII